MKRFKLVDPRSPQLRLNQISLNSKKPSGVYTVPEVIKICQDVVAANNTITQDMCDYDINFLYQQILGS